MATTSDPIVNPRNGCTLKRVISTTIRAMPTSAAITNRAPDAGAAGAAWASRRSALFMWASFPAAGCRHGITRNRVKMRPVTPTRG